MSSVNSTYSMVMIVDDSQSNSSLLKYILLSLNFAEEVVNFDSSLSALEYLGNKGKRKPDLIFLDLMNSSLHEADFFELVKLSNQDGGSTKIVSIKSLEKNSTNTVSNNNVVEYISKPLQGSDLSRILTRMPDHLSTGASLMENSYQSM